MKHEFKTSPHCSPNNRLNRVVLQSLKIRPFLFFTNALNRPCLDFQVDAASCYPGGWYGVPLVAMASLWLLWCPCGCRCFSFLYEAQLLLSECLKVFLCNFLLFCLFVCFLPHPEYPERIEYPERCGLRERCHTADFFCPFLFHRYYHAAICCSKGHTT